MSCVREQKGKGIKPWNSDSYNSRLGQMSSQIYCSPDFINAKYYHQIVETSVGYLLSMHGPNYTVPITRSRSAGRHHGLLWIPTIRHHITLRHPTQHFCGLMKEPVVSGDYFPNKFPSFVLRTKVQWLGLRLGFGQPSVRAQEPESGRSSPWPAPAFLSPRQSYFQVSPNGEPQ